MLAKFRPRSAYDVVAALALFIALGGVGVAATGGNFILGQAEHGDLADHARSAPVAAAGAPAHEHQTRRPPPRRSSLNVARGHAPMKVNRSTKVTNLNADLLDGLDSTAFLRKRRLQTSARHRRRTASST